MKLPIANCTLLAQPKGDISQFFGENPTLYRRFGLAAHNGIDFVRPHGTPLYAIEDGVVVSVMEEKGGFGRHIRILADAVDAKGLSREWTYAHNSAHHVKVGDRVTEGQHIADMGNSGFVVSGNTPYHRQNPYAGTHLHLGLRYARRTQRGWSYPGSTVRLTIENHGNGYKGSVDPMPILARIEALPPRSLLLQKLGALQTLLALMKRK